MTQCLISFFFNYIPCWTFRDKDYTKKNSTKQKPNNKMNKTPNLNAFLLTSVLKFSHVCLQNCWVHFHPALIALFDCEFPRVKLRHTQQIKKALVKNYSYDSFPSQTKFELTALKLKRLQNFKYFLYISKWIQYETVVISNSVIRHLLQREKDRSRWGYISAFPQRKDC